MRKLGALDGVMENFGPFDDAMGTLETLNKAMWKLCGEAKWSDGENGKLDPWWCNGTFGALWWRNWQIRDPSNGKFEALWWPDGEIGGPIDHKLFSNSLIRLHCTLSNLWAPNFNWKILDDMQAEKIYEAPILHFSFHIPRSCDDYQCLILVFSVIYLDSWGYIGWGPRPGIWKISFPLFSSFSFLRFLLFFSFSRGPL